MCLLCADEKIRSCIALILLVSPFNQWTRNPKVESLLAAEYFSSRLKDCKYCTISQIFPVTPPVHKVPDPFGAFPMEILISLSFGRDLYLPSMGLSVYACRLSVMKVDSVAIFTGSLFWGNLCKCPKTESNPQNSSPR